MKKYRADYAVRGCQSVNTAAELQALISKHGVPTTLFVYENEEQQIARTIRVGIAEFVAAELEAETKPKVTPAAHETYRQQATRGLVEMFRETFAHTGREFTTEHEEKIYDVVSDIINAVDEERILSGRGGY